MGAGTEAGTEKQNSKRGGSLSRLPKPHTSRGLVGSFCKHDIMKTTE